MNKILLIVFLIVITIAVGAYSMCLGKPRQMSITHKFSETSSTSKNKTGKAIANLYVTLSLTDSNSRSSQDIISTIKPNSAIQSTWKTYTNNQLGLTFRYPVTWRKYGKDINVSDRFKNVTEIEIDFIDSILNTTLSMECHLGPKGTGRYKFALSTFKSSEVDYLNGSKQIMIAGTKAIETFTTLNVNGKGDPIAPVLSIAIDFLNKQRTGSVELQFRTPVVNENVAIENLNLLLSTFKFIN